MASLAAQTYSPEQAGQHDLQGFISGDLVSLNGAIGTLIGVIRTLIGDWARFLSSALLPFYD